MYIPMDIDICFLIPCDYRLCEENYEIKAKC
jgi:hypothetical protein